MSWRTVVISKRCKLDLKMGYMVVRGEDTKRIFLDEISVLIIENTAIALTGCLIEELCRRKIKVIFCDVRHNPHSELIPICGSHDDTRKIREQIRWGDDIKEKVWTRIVSEKILNQARLLREIGLPERADMLTEYADEICPNDSTNREGHAAKVYFNALFGADFTRGFDCVVNSALNYGYGILLSLFNREICANGYLTQLGIFHDNIFNHFNLGSDLMEPFRVIVDKYVYYAEYEQFESDQKHDMLKLFHQTCEMGGARQTVINAVGLYVKSVFRAIEMQNPSEVRFATI